MKQVGTGQRKVAQYREEWRRVCDRSSTVSDVAPNNNRLTYEFKNGSRD